MAARRNKKATGRMFGGCGQLLPICAKERATEILRQSNAIHRTIGSLADRLQAATNPKTP
jgi:hypothetical protein